MNFGEAFDAIKKVALENAADPANAFTAKGMRLPSWKDDVVIKVQVPDKFSKMTAPYLYVQSRFGRVPWKETMIELFSIEWEVVDVD